MSVYFESSALLAWILDEARADDVRSVLDSAESVAISELTLLEAERTLVRLESDRRLAPDRARAARQWLEEHTAGWTVLPLNEAVLTAARTRFPKEPVRTLDAIHLACAIVLRTEVRDLAVASLDDRVRENAKLLAFRVVP